MSVNAFLQKDYENEPPSGPKKQTQTNPILSAVGGFRKAKMNKKSLARKSSPFQQTKKNSGQSRKERLELQFWMNCQFQIYIN